MSAHSLSRAGQIARLNDRARRDMNLLPTGKSGLYPAFLSGSGTTLPTPTCWQTQ